ncbi:NAC-alpha domain-containing protein 1 [Cucumis melo var. makuwa]|uniref:NAC-alpha domain-containing protein 1 n=2 Tax=Cucumis melo var. makuwa TaxID=1194695 RepID=A0A5A7UXH3_CUCMM|nr:NAC-alpha domain-containing protein 1 [Cucumis melo var. makuwa]
MALLFSFEGSTELTPEFSGLAVDPLSVDSIEGHNRVSVTVQYVVEHWSGCCSWSLDGEGQCLNLYYLTDKAYGGTCALRISASFGSTRLIGASFGSTRLMCASFGSTRLIRASFGSTRLIRASFGSTRLMCASFGSTRLICASFGSTRLICASFGSTRLICAFYGTTRLLCRVGAQREADRREAGRMREGHMDASGFLIASAMYFVRIF